MKSIRHLIVISALFTLLVSCGSNEGQRNNPRDLSANLAEKEHAVWNAMFQDLEGNEVKLSDYKGKVVLMDFWETWCGPCLQVFPMMDSLKNEYPEDFVVLAVNLNSSDDKSDVVTFKENNDYNFDYLLDVNSVGAEIIDIGIPFKMYFDPEGYLIKAELGVSGNDYANTKKVIEENRES